MRAFIHSIVLSTVLMLCGAGAMAQFQIGVSDSVYSSVLHEERKLMVYLPREIREGKGSALRFPVMYVLDGDTHFLSVAGMIDQLSDAGGNAVLPRMIVVFIPNTQRTRDLTPYPVKTNFFMSDEMAKESGGGERFIQCLRDEIIPYIESKYPVTRYRALVGHSFGGIFTLNVLANHPDLFEDYIAIDPSTWYDDRRFARSVIEKIRKGSYAGKSLFLAIANTTNVADTAKVKQLHTPFSEHEKSLLEFCADIRSIKPSALQVSVRYYPNDDHNSVPMIATYDGLRTIFKDYRFTYNDLLEKSYRPSVDLPAYFAKLSKKIQFTLTVPADMLELGDLYFGVNKDKEKQEEVRSLYRKLYPEKAKAFLDTKRK